MTHILLGLKLKLIRRKLLVGDFLIPLSVRYQYVDGEILYQSGVES